ncbi:MAG: hypothetical protein WC356_06525 [Candidatus Micrarchaeia archaeon]|jgi:hypothetical protein
MGEKLRLRISKWRDVLVVFGIYGALVMMLLKSNETLGEITATNTYLVEGRKENATNIKGIDAKVDTLSIAMTKMVITLDKLEQRQTLSEERQTIAKQEQAITDIEIIRLLKINNLQPYNWKDLSILPDLKRK